MSIGGLSIGKGTLLGTGYIKVTADTSEAESSLGVLGKGFAIGAAALTGVVAAGAAVTTMANNFNNDMRQIQTQAGGSAKDVQYLSTAVLNLKDVQQSPDQLAEALYHLKSVGLDNVTAMKDLKIASDLASVGNADLETTTNALAGAWRSGIKGAQDMGQAAATVNAIIGAGNMRMTDFVSAISTGILPSAKSFGLSLNQVGAALALMTDEGIPAVEASTRLRMSFSLLGAPSGAAEKQLKKIGLTGLDLANAMRGPDGLIGAIQLLKDHLDASGMSAAEQSELLAHAFGGGKSDSAILTMLNNLDVLKKKQDQINGSMGAFPAAVQTQQQSMSAQIKIMENNLEEIGIKIGETLIGPVTSFVTFLNQSALPAVTSFFSAITKSIPTKAIGDDLASFMKEFTGSGGSKGPGSSKGSPYVFGSGNRPSEPGAPGFVVAAPSGPFVFGSGGRPGGTTSAPGFVTAASTASAPNGFAQFGADLKKVFTGDLIPDLKDIAQFLGDAAKAAGNLAVAVEPLLEFLAGIGLKTLGTLADLLAHQIGPALVAVTGFIKDNSTWIGILLTVYLTPLLAKLLVLNTIKSITAVGGLAKDIATFPVENFSKIKQGISDFTDSLGKLKNPLSGFTDPGGPLDELKLRGMYAGEALTTFKGKVVDLAQASWETVTTQVGNLVDGTKLLGQNISTLASAGWDKLGQGVLKVQGWFSDAATAASDLGSKALDAVKAFGEQAWAGAVKAVGALRDGINAMKDSEIAATIAEKAQAAWAVIVTGAEKAWDVIQAILDAELWANPLVLIIGSLTLLAVGLYEAYQHSQTFRDIVNAAFKSVGEAASFMWNDVIKPAFKFLVETFLSVAGSIIDGAAKMFGWVPGVGDMLKSAASEFDKFRDHVNASLGGIQSKTIPVSVTVNGKTLPEGSVTGHTYTSTTGWSYADGGPITGGTPGKDSVVILAMPGEHVLTAPEVQRLGGHQSVYAMRRGIMRGELPAYAAGGPVLAVRTSVPTETGMDNVMRPMAQTVITSSVAAMMSSLAKALKDWASSGISVAGGALTQGHAQVIAAAMAAAGVPPPGSGAQWMSGMNTLIGRESGWNPNAINLTDINAQMGDPSRGLAQTIMSTFTAYHAAGTSWNIFDPVANVAAAIRYIVSRYGNITNVQQADPSRPPQGYDLGGVAVGRGLLPKYTPAPERVLSPAQTAVFERAMAGAGHGGSGAPIELHVHFDGPVGSPLELENWLTRALVSLKRNGRLRQIVPGT